MQTLNMNQKLQFLLAHQSQGEKMNSLGEDRYFDGLLNAHLAKGDKAEARQDRIDEIAEDIIAVKTAAIATVKLTERAGGYVSKRSPLADILEEIDETAIAGLGKLLNSGLYLTAGLVLDQLVKAQIKKEADDEAEQQVDEEGGEYL